MACVSMHYAKYLQANSPENALSRMALPVECFKVKANATDTFAKLRHVIAPCYVYLFSENIAKKAIDDKLVALLRNNPFAMLHLSNLIGGEQELCKLWERPEIREKLFNPR